MEEQNDEKRNNDGSFCVTDELLSRCVFEFIYMKNYKKEQF